MTNTEQILLQAETRQLRKKKVKQLRSESIIPGVVYGHNRENIEVQVKLQDLFNAYQKSGESTLVDLSIDKNEPLKVLIQTIDRDAVTDEVHHVDFYAVNMKETIHAEVVLHFIGEAPAVKALGGILVKNKDHVAIKCLPQDLISELEVDISALNTFDDSIKVSDLPLTDKVEILDALDTVIVLVSPPRSEEELAALNEEVKENVAAVEGVEKPEPAAEEKKTA